MIALLSVWMGLLTFLLAVAMLVYRPLMTDITIPAVLWIGAPGAMCLGGLVLWAYRKEREPDDGLYAQRAQAKTAILLAVLAAAIVYVLIFRSEKLEPVGPAEDPTYNQAAEAQES